MCWKWAGDSNEWSMLSNIKAQFSAFPYIGHTLQNKIQCYAFFPHFYQWWKMDKWEDISARWHYFLGSCCTGDVRQPGFGLHSCATKGKYSMCLYIPVMFLKFGVCFSTIFVVSFCKKDVVLLFLHWKRDMGSDFFIRFSALPLLSLWGTIQLVCLPTSYTLKKSLRHKELQLVQWSCN